MSDSPIILFDVMGTLVHDPFFDEMPSFFGLSFDALLKATHPTAWVEFEVAARSESAFLRDFFADGRQFDHQGFLACVQDAYRWLAGMEDLLDELRARGHQVHAFSNYPVWYQRIEERLEVSRFLRWSFVSWDTKLRKPSEEAYRHVLDSLGVGPDQCVFVDDRRTNCEVASTLGIDTIRFLDAEVLRRALTERGIL